MLKTSFTKRPDPTQYFALHVKPYVYVMAPLPPQRSFASIEATKLVHQLAKAGAHVTTSTYTGGSIAGARLRFSSHKKYKQSLKAIENEMPARHQHAVIFASLLLRESEPQSTWRQRLKEKKRKLKFLATMFRRSQSVTLVGCNRWQRRFLKSLWYFRKDNDLPIRKTLQFCSIRDTAETVLTGLKLPKLAAIDLHAAVKDTLEIAAHCDTDKRLTAGKLLGHIRALGLNLPEIERLIKYSKDPVICGHKVVAKVKYLGGATHWDTQRIDDNRFVKCANKVASHGVTKYMLHLREALGLKDKFPLNSKGDCQRLIEWYTGPAAHLLESGWVPPITPPIGRQVASNSACKWIVRVLDGDTSDLENPKKRAEFALVLALVCKAEVPIGDPIKLLQSSELYNWFTQVFSMDCGNKGASRVKTIGCDSIQLVGNADGKTGLCNNLRMSMKALQRAKIPVQTRGVQSQPINQGVARITSKELRKNVVIHHVNADKIPRQILSPEFTCRDDQYHIGFLLWELEAMPKAHQLGIDLLDEIWAPSEFVANVYRQHTDTPIHVVKKGIEVPASSQLMQNSSGFTCLICFDAHSSVERKNPLAGVVAFQLAFPQKQYPDVRLIVKTTPIKGKHWGDPADQLGLIKKKAYKDPRIQVIEDHIPQRELMSLISCASCLISTHRAEGFGYIPAFAMAYETPVIATDYGGVRDFCTLETSFPIEWTACPVPDGHSIFPVDDGFWANVDVEAVAHQFSILYISQEEAEKRSKKGRCLMEDVYSIAAQAERYKARLKAIDAI